MSKTIVVPVIGRQLDPSGVSEAAIPVAQVFARRTGAEVVLVSVVEIPSGFAALVQATGVATWDEERWVAERQASIEPIAARFPEGRARIVVRVGDPVTQVLDVLAGLEDPILVMASHARAGVSRLLIGSVAFRIVHRAPCPVVIVRAGADLPVEPMETEWPRVLVPLDGSTFAEHALDRALAALGTTDLDLRLIHVIEPLVDFYGYAAAEYLRAGQEWAERYLSDIAKRLAARGYRVSWAIRVGRVAHQIQRYAEEERIQLIAMATHGRSGFSRLVFGSVAERLLHESRAPLLLVRPDEAAIEQSEREAAEAGRA